MANEPERTSDDPDYRRSLRIRARRDRALGEVWRWLLVSLVLAAAIGVGHQAWIAGREPLQQVTIGEWEPLITIGTRDKEGKTVIQVRLRQDKHQVYVCGEPVIFDSPIEPARLYQERKP